MSLAPPTASPIFSSPGAPGRGAGAGEGAGDGAGAGQGAGGASRKENSAMTKSRPEVIEKSIVVDNFKQTATDLGWHLASNLRTPAIVGIVADSDFLAFYSDSVSLAQQYFSFPQLIQDLVTITTLYCHSK